MFRTLVISTVLGLATMYLRKAVLLLKAGGAPSTAVAARIADSIRTDSVVRTSEVLGALADGIRRGGDERPWRAGRSDGSPARHHSNVGSGTVLPMWTVVTIGEKADNSQGRPEQFNATRPAAGPRGPQVRRFGHTWWQKWPHLLSQLFRKRKWVYFVM